MANPVMPEGPDRYGADQRVRSLPTARPEIGPDLRGAFTIVWTHKWSILAITLVVVGVALLVSSRQTPVYESETRVLVIPVSDIGAAVPLQDPNLATESELIESVAVAELVAEQLGTTDPPRQLLPNLSVDQPTDTDILEISYRHADPLQAQRLAAAFGAAYLRFRTETVNDAVLLAAQDIEEQLAELVRDLNGVNRQLRGLAEDDPDRGILEVRANLLSAQITPLQLELVVLPDEVTVGRIIEPAPLPGSPISPNHVVNGVFGLAAGLALGMGLAFLRDRLSERVRSTEEVEAYLEAPVLAAIPRVPSWRRRRQALLVTAVQGRSPAAEAYRVLRTNVLSTATAAGTKSIAVTSLYAGEGKSATVANLGVVLAKAGKRVALVSADLRRPRLHEFFKRENHPGLVDVLAQRATLAQTLQIVTLPTRGFDTGSATLPLLPSGRVPDDPSELITSERMAEIVAELESISDIVLLDLPPVLPVTDALVVAAVTKHVLLVLGPKADTRPAIISARQQLDRVGARILGGVLNGPDPSLGQSYYSY